MNKKIHISARGKVIDFDSLQASSPNTIAVGNAQYNARGDRLGIGGKIEKTAAEISRETAPRTGSVPPTKQVSIKNNLDDLKNARNNWISPQVVSANPEDALDISQAAELLDGVPLEEVKSKKQSAKKNSAPKAKRTVSDE